MRETRVADLCHSGKWNTRKFRSLGSICSGEGVCQFYILSNTDFVLHCSFGICGMKYVPRQTWGLLPLLTIPQQTKHLSRGARFSPFCTSANGWGGRSCSLAPAHTLQLRRLMWLMMHLLLILSATVTQFALNYDISAFQFGMSSLA